MVGMCQENICQPVLTVLYAFRNPLLIVRWFSTHLLHAASQDLSCQERSSSCDLFKSASEPKFPGECVLISFEPPAQRSDQHLANSPSQPGGIQRSALRLSAEHKVVDHPHELLKWSVGQPRQWIVPQHHLAPFLQILRFAHASFSQFRPDGDSRIRGEEIWRKAHMGISARNLCHDLHRLPPVGIRLARETQDQIKCDSNSSPLSLPCRLKHFVNALMLLIHQHQHLRGSRLCAKSHMADSRHSQKTDFVLAHAAKKIGGGLERPAELKPRIQESPRNGHGPLHIHEEVGIQKGHFLKPPARDESRHFINNPLSLVSVESLAVVNKIRAIIARIGTTDARCVSDLAKPGPQLVCIKISHKKGWGREMVDVLDRTIRIVNHLFMLLQGASADSLHAFSFAQSLRDFQHGYLPLSAHHDISYPRRKCLG